MADEFAKHLIFGLSLTLAAALTRVVEIFGEMREAHLLLSLADKICPTAMPDIAKAISRVREK